MSNANNLFSELYLAILNELEHSQCGDRITTQLETELECAHNLWMAGHHIVAAIMIERELDKYDEACNASKMLQARGILHSLRNSL